MSKRITGRRDVMAGLGAVATAAALGSTSVSAQGGAATFQPTLHPTDDWMSAMPGKHRVLLDVTSPEGLPDAIRFAGNLFTGSKNGYGLDDADMAIMICLRHSATAYGYGDAVWAKYGKLLAPKVEPTPTGNPYNSGERMQLSGLAKRGVQFIVCGTASRGIAGRLAGQGGDADALLKTEMVPNLLPNSRLVAAGVVGVLHAQERGFRLIFVG